jgi:hypothetical protein
MMLPIESYRDILGDYGRRHHVVGSAWIVVAALAIAIFLFV